jgi:MFS family permease
VFQERPIIMARLGRLLRVPLKTGERSALKLHLTAQALGAVASGVVLNHDYIAGNGLGGSVAQITVLAMIWPVSNLFSVLASHWLDSTNSHFRAMMVGAVMRLSVAMMVFSSSVNTMLLLLLLFFGSNSVVIPGTNAALRHRYRKGNRGVLFGWGMSVFNLVSLPASILVGAILDADFSFYRWLFLAEGVFGAGQAFCFAMMVRGLKNDGETPSVSVREMLRGLGAIFRADREFVLFEAFFMLYGFGFMGIQPAIPFFARDVLHLSYEQYATAKGVLGQLGLVFLGPLLGAGLERIRPFRFTGHMCMVLAWYPLLLVASSLMPDMGVPLFYGAWVMYTAGMAGVQISWNMSSMHFAPEGKAATYQGFHVTATALRGFVAPALGSAVMQIASYTANFAMSAGFFLAAGILFLRHAGKRKTLSQPPPAG